jgi:Lytic polysaccharide mono-oxygenase, cellulose-degrading
MHRVHWLFGSFILAAMALFAPDAKAHIKLISPPPRDSGLKAGPCGTAGSVRGNNVTTFKPGQKITVRWQETVSHPGHYRISFDDNGDDAFVEPKSFTDTYTAPSVLLDNIADKTGLQMYTQVVTLPNIECDHCTLQLIQVMTDKAPYGDGNDIYHQCADIVLSAGTTASSSSASTGASSSASTGASSSASTGASSSASTGASSSASGGSTTSGDSSSVTASAAEGAGGGDSGAPGEDKGGCAYRAPGSRGGASPSLALLVLGLGVALLRGQRRRGQR